MISINLIDIIIAGIMLRCIYIGATKGLFIEFFKLLGMIFATFITIHYYARMGIILANLLIIPVHVGEILSFSILWIFVVIVFKIMCDGLLVVLKTEAHPIVDKTVGTVIAVIRSLFVCGLAFIIIFVSGNSELIESAHQSGSGFYLVDFSPNVYDVMFEKFIIKFFPYEEKNEAVFELIAEETEEEHY